MNQNIEKQIEKENEERYLSNLKENPAKHIDALPERPGEIWFDKLDEGTRFQVLTRYLGDISAYCSSLLQIIADQYVLIEFICEKQGIDVKAKKKELAKKYKEEQEKQIAALKEQIKNCKA